MNPVTDPALLALLEGDSPQGGPVLGPAPKPEKPPAPKTSYRPLSSQEAAAMGLPAGGVYQVSSEGNVTTVSAAPKPEAGDSATLSPEDREAVKAEAAQKYRLIQSLNQRSRDGWFATGFGAGTAGNFPGTTAYDVASDVQTVSASGALQRIMEMARNNGGKNPLTPLSNADFQALGQSIANLEPTQSDAQFQRNLQAYGDIYRRAFIAAGGDPAELDAGVTTTDRQDPTVSVGAGGTTPPGGGGDPTPPVLSPGDPQYAASTGTRTVDSGMGGVETQYRQMLAENRPTGEIIKMLRDAGAGPQTLMQAVQQIKYRRENPNVPIDKYSISTTTEVPISAAEQLITDVGSGAAGAYAMGAGQFLSGNTLDNMAGDRGGLALDVAQASNPGAYGMGEVSGGILAGLTGEAGLARLGMASGLFRGVAADGLAGAANGAGMADGGNRLAGAAQGGIAGSLGSLAGAGAMKGVGRALSPSGGSLSDLYAAGVRPTPGQRFADSGIAGKALNAMEEGLQSVPFVGSAIAGARQESRDQFQTGAFNEALKEIGEQLPAGMKVGTAPHAYAQKAFDKIYDEARSGMRLVGDEELSNQLGEISQQVGNLAEPSIKRFNVIFKNMIARRVGDGELSGEAFKKAHSDLGKQIRSIRNNPSGDGELADALTSLQDALDAAARRHSEPEAVALLDRADAGYAKFVRIEEAAKSRGGDAGTFTPTQFDSAVQKTTGGTRSKAYLRGDALMQDYAEKGKALVDRLPNSGTTDRALTVGGLGAAGASFLRPEIAAFLGTIGAAYMPGVRRVTKGAMAPSSGKRAAIAARLKKIERLSGGATGALVLQGTSPAQ